MQKRNVTKKGLSCIHLYELDLNWHRFFRLNIYFICFFYLFAFCCRRNRQLLAPEMPKSKEIVESDEDLTDKEEVSVITENPLNNCVLFAY